MPSKIEQGKDLELLASLNGKHVRIPDLGPIFSSWPNGVNKHYKALKEATKDFLESFDMKEKKLKKQIEIDYALSGSMWWQQGDFNELRAIIFFVIWLFNYDDDIDEPTGQHSDDLELAKEVHRTAILFIQHCLGLGNQGDINNTPRNPNISSFKVIGDYLRAEYSGEQRQVSWMR
ncbi:hypothetical protein MMC18_006296 [Xylographa bjoerkii]|nr:hypothetical protein [Xylographa bjoerkii]